MSADHAQPATKFSHYEHDGYRLRFEGKKGRWVFETPEKVAVATFPENTPAEALSGMVDIYASALKVGVNMQETA